MDINTKNDIRKFDFILVIIVFTTIIMGIIAIGSATHINLGDEMRATYNSQKVWFAIGIFLMFACAFIDYNFLGRFYILAYAVNISLLVAVLLLGVQRNGAVRWLSFGSGENAIGIQPSEFAKILMIFFLAKIIDKKKEKINNIFVFFLIGILGIIPVVLVIMQKSLSASIVLLSILAISLFVGKLSYKYIICILLIVIPLGYVFVIDIQKPQPLIADKILFDHQYDRVMSFISPDADKDASWQTNQSINAIGSGQLKGKGLYNSSLNKLSLLPEPHNDFIFSIIGEEFGFIGCIVVLSMLLLIIFRCLWIAKNSVDVFGRLIATGVAGMIAFQTFVNVGVTTGILPNTGMPLPFVSYGGSSLWTNMISIGLVLNIGMKKEKSLFEGD